MDRIMLVAAVLPVFGLLLFLVSGPLARWGAAVPPGRVAPPLYVAVLAAATVAVVVHTGGRPEQLGLRAPELSGTGRLWAGPLLAAAAMLLVGAAAALLTYFAELWLVSRRWARPGRPGQWWARPGRRGGSGRPGPPPGAGHPAGGSAAIQAVRSWLPNPAGFLALGALTAVLEELLWRGYLLDGLRTDIWLLAALAIQAVLFGLAHLPFGPRHMLAKAFSGLVWGVLVVGFGTVLVGIVAHLGFQVLAARRLRRQSTRLAVLPGGEPRAVQHAESA